MACHIHPEKVVARGKDEQGRVVEAMPQACPHGHPYRPPSVSIGWCGSHRYADCNACRRDGLEPARVCYRFGPSPNPD